MTTYHILGFAASAIGIATLFILGRLVGGPTLADRAVALDTMNTFVVALMILLSAFFDSVVMVDIAIVYGALSFVSTMFIARYLEGGL